LIPSTRIPPPPRSTLFPYTTLFRSVKYKNTTPVATMTKLVMIPSTLNAISTVRFIKKTLRFFDDFFVFFSIYLALSIPSLYLAGQSLPWGFVDLHDRARCLQSVQRSPKFLARQSPVQLHYLAVHV